jgi:hypothetical protein
MNRSSHNSMVLSGALQWLSEAERGQRKQWPRFLNIILLPGPHKSNRMTIGIAATYVWQMGSTNIVEVLKMFTGTNQSPCLQLSAAYEYSTACKIVSELNLKKSWWIVSETKFKIKNITKNLLTAGSPSVTHKGITSPVRPNCVRYLEVPAGSLMLIVGKVGPINAAIELSLNNWPQLLRRTNGGQVACHVIWVARFARWDDWSSQQPPLAPA